MAGGGDRAGSEPGQSPQTPAQGFQAGAQGAAGTANGKSRPWPADADAGQGPSSKSPEQGLGEGQPQLPKLTRADYYINPTLEDLSERARADPSALASVKGLTVGRHGFGHVRWPGPVDLRGLDLDALVHIRSKVLEVYPDETEKPPEGTGLNQPATVSLLKVFKIDKSTGKPSTDPAAVKKFRKRLVEHSAEQDSKFVSYDPETGEWVFEVTHFSRYGLDDDSDEDDEDDGPAADDPDDDEFLGLAKRRAQRAAAAEGAAEDSDEAADSDEHMSGIDGGSGGTSPNRLAAVPSGRQPTGPDGSPGDLSADDSISLELVQAPHGAAGRSAPLAHSLPAHLQLDVDDLVGIRSALPPDHTDPTAPAWVGPRPRNLPLIPPSSVPGLSC